MKTDIKKLYYSIGEVSEMVSLKSYVLRYWETEFKQLSPPKNNAGNRTYRQKDIDLIIKIKDLLYNKKFTIKGAKQYLKEFYNVDVSKSNVLNISNKSLNKDFLIDLKKDLSELIKLINKKID